NDDSRRDEIAFHGPARRDLDAVLRTNVTLNLPLDVHGLRVNLGLDLAGGADDQVVVLELDFPLDSPLDGEVLVTGQLTSDDNRLTDLSYARRFHHPSTYGFGGRRAGRL